MSKQRAEEPDFDDDDEEAMSRVWERLHSGESLDDVAGMDDFEEDESDPEWDEETRKAAEWDEEARNAAESHNE